MRFLLTLGLLALPLFSEAKEVERVRDYFKILKVCPPDSAVPAAIITQLQSFKGTELEDAVVEGLIKEFQSRGAQAVKLCRREAASLVKDYSAKRAEDIKSTMASFKRVGEFSEKKTIMFYAHTKKLTEDSIPAEIEWSDEVKSYRKILSSLKAAVDKMDSSRSPADFAILEYIAKVSVSPLFVNDKTVSGNLKFSGRIPFQCLAAAYQINFTRALAGLDTLAIDPKLTQVAFAHSKDMDKNNYLDHESPTPGMKTLQDRARKFKASASLEILGRGTTDVLKLNTAYLKRFKNAGDYYGPWKRIGVGYSGKYWTQVFGK